jgi:hypothetical protein
MLQATVLETPAAALYHETNIKDAPLEPWLLFTFMLRVSRHVVFNLLSGLAIPSAIKLREVFGVTPERCGATHNRAKSPPGILVPRHESVRPHECCYLRQNGNYAPRTIASSELPP